MLALELYIYAGTDIIETMIKKKTSVAEGKILVSELKRHLPKVRSYRIYEELI